MADYYADTKLSHDGNRYATGDLPAGQTRAQRLATQRTAYVDSIRGPVTVPVTAGLTAQAAANVLGRAGFTLGANATVTTGGSVGTVTVTNPVAGSVRDVGTAVAMTVVVAP
jgi:hypothetical protein